MAPARTRGFALAVCVLFTLTACGTTTGASSTTTTANESVVAEERSIKSEQALPFGDDFQFQSGITVAVTAPKTFTPSETAYPQSPRAVAFDISIFNGSNRPYRLSDLGVTATVASSPAKQVMDATQGFNGIVNADRDVPPRGNVRLTLAFAIPAKPAPLSLELRPDRAIDATAVYTGSV
ncbi:hypothetical protein [Amycolatopsis palatopharyngis]|uniref:hypothetical protein n=1 Tax=Amycolatopsis palatopharyngis TaxID=187982 RepID=UPI000E25584B|nr:hypothetical protein [Amycolatopsis palatopharyngis]